MMHQLYGLYPRLSDDGNQDEYATECEKVTYEAIKTGYRLIDTATAYRNEVICCELQMSDILANVVNLAGFYIC